MDGWMGIRMLPPHEIGSYGERVARNIIDDAKHSSDNLFFLCYFNQSIMIIRPVDHHIVVVMPLQKMLQWRSFCHCNVADLLISAIICVEL
jgi:hypothetical protein